MVQPVGSSMLHVAPSRETTVKREISPDTLGEGWRKTDRSADSPRGVNSEAPQRTGESTIDAAYDRSDAVYHRHSTSRHADSGGTSVVHAQARSDLHSSRTVLARIAVERSIEDLVPEHAMKSPSGGPRSDPRFETTEPSFRTHGESLQGVVSAFQQLITGRATDRKAFHALLEQSFGSRYDIGAAERLRLQTLDGDFGWMPNIRVADVTQLRDRSELHGSATALGAYDASTDTIFLNRSMLTSNPDQAERIFTEEMGHALDTRLNALDAAGDEGEIFSRLAQGDVLSAGQLADLRSENDIGQIEINGHRMDVEFGLLKKLGRSIRTGFESLARSIGNGFRELAQNPFIGSMRSMDRFVPVLFVQAATLVLNAARAGVALYQGVRHRSIAAVVGGIAGLAAGVAKIGDALGSTGSWVDQARRLAGSLDAARSTYRALAQRDFEAILNLLGNRLDPTYSLADLIDQASTAHASYLAQRNGDFLGAVGVGTALLRLLVNSGANETIERISDGVTLLSAIKSAFSSGDVTGALQLAGDALDIDSRADPAQHHRWGDWAQTLLLTRQFVERLERRDYAGAATLLKKISSQSWLDASSYRALETAIATLNHIDHAIRAAESGDYTSAIDSAARAIRSPLDDRTRQRLVELQQTIESLRSLQDAVADRDAERSIQLLRRLTKSSELGELLGNVAEVAVMLERVHRAIDRGQYAEAANIIRASTQGLSNPGISGLLLRVAILLDTLAAVQLPPATTPAHADP